MAHLVITYIHPNTQYKYYSSVKIEISFTTGSVSNLFTFLFLKLFKKLRETEYVFEHINTYVV